MTCALSQSEAQVVTRLTPTSPDYQDDFAAALALTEADDGTWALVGAPGDNDATGDAGSVFAYYRPDGGAWELQTQIFAPGEPVFQGGFGNAVALSGRWAVVGETGYAAPGQAYVLRREGEGMASEWVVEAVLTPESLAHPDHVFGVDVALDTSSEAGADGGFVAVVGAVTRETLDPVPGAVHVFRRDVGESATVTWAEEALFSAHKGEAVDQFGLAVAADAGRIAVGAYREGYEGDGTGGAVYVYAHGIDSWEEEERVRPDGASWFGAALGLDAEWMLVGSPNEDCPSPDPFIQCGATYFYERTEAGWQLRHRFQPTDLTDYDLFGVASALALPYAIVAAPLWDTEGPNNAGAAYLYRLDGDAWNFERLLRSPDPGINDDFGVSVALTAATALVGTTEALGAVYAIDLVALLPNQPGGPAPLAEEGTVFSLSVYPNPTGGVARLTYSLGTSGHVRVEVADMLGRVVWRREMGGQPAGMHTLELEGLHLTAGVYVVRVTDERTGSAASIRFLHVEH